MNILKYISNWKYRFFKKKIRQVECAIADLEFKLFKVRELREERRKQRDRTVEAIDAIQAKLLNPANTKEDTESMNTQLTEQTAYQKYLTGQIDALDMEINGVKATEDKQEYNGVIQQIDAARELLAMYKEYADRL